MKKQVMIEPESSVLHGTDGIKPIRFRSFFVLLLWLEVRCPLHCSGHPRVSFCLARILLARDIVLLDSVHISALLTSIEELSDV